MSAFVIADITVNDPESYEENKNLHRRLLQPMEESTWHGEENLKNLKATGNPTEL